MAKQQLIPLTVYNEKTKESETWEYFFVDPRSGIIYFSKSHAGRKVKFSTHEKNPNKAKRFANLEFNKRLGTKSKHVRTLIKHEMSAWLKVKESEGWDPETMTVIRRAKKYNEEFWGNKLPSEINRDTIVEWFAWWKSEKGNLGMENYIKYFKNFCRYLSEKTVGDRPLLPAVPKIVDPNKKAVQIARAKKKERVFADGEITRIIETAANSDDALVVAFMFYMATRIEETLSLDFERTIILDTEIPVYRWFAGQNKADLAGEHALALPLIEPLRALRERRRKEGTALLFPQKRDNQKPMVEQMINWKAWRKRAALDWHWTSHMLRHTCLTRLFNDPALPQAAILKQYRVSLKVALETYVKTTRESQLKLRDAIQLDAGLVANLVRLTSRGAE